ncbi:FtsX-like permease family protein [Clostridium fungisolvens]|uniref:Bacitracin export permease protein BceB n=1 Tax=Clostridium fungisolvens TaxID=1604897 RepID=A0A6V8SIH0_9CLOT|nr:ABC transporter permease [Clostridium fungisolvens]GFP76536.1 Bacitracin export permease protein BceB [Clostridium fungisolvens]
MGLMDIAIKNIKRNFYNYFLYFVSMVFSIMIYFTFTSIQYNTQVQRIVGASVQFSTVFKSAAAVIGVFIAIFIWYSNSFFIRRRKKEVALYSLLGIRKKQIGTMLFYENIVMGAAALIAGIVMGSLLSKVFIMLLIRLMGFSADIAFMIPLKAVINTALVFLVLFLITSIHGYMLIYRFKLIELFKAESQGEREPKTSVFKSILSVMLIGGGYLIYTKGSLSASVISIPVTLLLTVIGTFMLFSSLTLLIIKLAKKNERRYFKGSNMIGTSQLLYRIKASARTLATIAVLSAATLTAMELSTSFYYKLEVNLQENYGFTYAYASNDNSLDKKVEAVIAEYPKNKIISAVDMKFAKVKGQWPDLSKGLSAKKTFDTSFYIISESNYNEIAKARGLKDKIKLKDNNEAAIFTQILNFTSEYDDYLGKTITIVENNEKLSLKVSDFKAYSLTNSGMMRNSVVVSDEVYNNYRTNANTYRIKGYITDNKKDSEDLTKGITKLVSEEIPQKDGEPFVFSSYYMDYRAGITYSGLIIFLGAFLGLLFLIATGSIIFFKQLSEANDDKSRYGILRKIGLTNKEIKISISKQIFIVFSLPLVIGITHSLVASTLLSKIMRINLALPITLTIGAYTVIYMVYYFLTVNSYYNIVSSDN